MSRARKCRQVQVGQERLGGSCYVTAILVVVAAVAAALYGLNGTDLPSTATPAHLLARATLVPRRPLGNATYRELAELRVPLIITSSVAEKWGARKHFTTAFLANKLPHVMAYKQETNRVFKTFHDNKALEPLVNEKWEDFNLKVNVTIPQVLAWPSPTPHRGPYLYFSQKLVTLRSMFPDVLDYIQPLNDLILSTENIQVNLWIGRHGITTHTHYDATFNFFVQLQGKKRFTLIPPNQPMYLYPCLHPHYGHSQIDIADPDMDQFAAYRPQPHIAEVSPGDMLLVPPFWFHHVETLEESVSVNVWSNAPEFALINEIYTKAMPFEESWGQHDLIKASRVFIEMILASLNITDHSSFLKIHILSQRYQPIVQSGNLFVNRTLVTDMAELCERTDWIAVISVAISELLSEDLQRLLKEANELRRMADRIVCSCNDPNCPFRPQRTAPLYIYDRTQSLPAGMVRVGTNGSCDSDCEYASDDEGPLQTCRFTRTQPARRATSPGSRRLRLVPRVRSPTCSMLRTLVVPSPRFHREYHSVPALSSST